MAITMKTTPKKFKDIPAPVYHAASIGEEVIIEHAHYKHRGQVFKLVAVDKEEEHSDGCLCDECLCRMDKTLSTRVDIFKEEKEDE